MPVELDTVSYAYGRNKPRILNQLTYTTPDGFTVLLGPNGAGKSTLLKLAAGVNQPTTGAVRLGRLPSTSREYRTRVAWMPQTITAMTGLTAREQVAYTGWLKGMNRADAWTAAATALDRVQMKDRADVKTKQLSGGQLRRVGVASALVHDARVLLLDEPTAGMDPTQRRVFRDLILHLATDEVQVLMSTHDVADLAEEADTVTVLTEGTVTFTGGTRDFLAHAPSGTPEGRRAEAAYTTVSAYSTLSD
ncbi:MULTISPECIES: ATP-binding cassette domain-containing protein [Streptomyces]|uniref:ATP-binding cassette domain-containing protein n=1 Tax=Streptomyces TaxID=1883 RepID=UPI001E381283|nr:MULTISPECIES: ATP-binding cassette domain-containing protein [Streptomyces]UFQ15420.1 ATP-binding cassette domain-containing protein [Streptomyces huasconensis]WCL85024.1 ATP-binding cassette domain-containing protein [Streptomyces sp. JCM 35825]